ncbi:unnamed protein product [Sympodiomycopsis kandeliae]
MAHSRFAFSSLALLVLAAIVALATPSIASHEPSRHNARAMKSMRQLRNHAIGRNQKDTEVSQSSKRDAYTDLRMTQDGGDGPTLANVGTRPAGAEATTIPMGLGADLFAWKSKTPHKDADAKQVFIILHGIKRNAGTYFSILNNAFAKARDAGAENADKDSIRLAPLLFSTERDAAALNSTTLGWADPNVWTGGDGSTHPPLSGLSVFTVLDKLLERFADKSKYPKMRQITFLAHGGGAQVIQRYAVLGRNSPRSSVEVRYVVGDPSSMLYFTEDRPVSVDKQTCPRFNDFRYGFNDYQAPYSLRGQSPSDLYKRYIKRDVRYTIGEADTRIDKGDQSCMGRAAGGPFRRDRSLDYWAYLHLLGGSSKIPEYPGWFPALDSDGAKAQANKNSTDFPTSSKSARKAFPKKAKIHHQLFTIPDAGHSAKAVFGSDAGRDAIFGP